MTHNSKSKMKVIKIMDPLMCVRCDHAYIADVVMRDGEQKKMFYCSRLDCDNWATQANNTQDQDLDMAA